MTWYNKALLYVVGIVILLVTMIFITATVKKRAVISSVTRARYAVYLSDETTVQTNYIPPNVAQAIADKIKASSSIRIVGKKSVCFAIIDLLDGDMQPIVHLGVLKYPLFQFDGIQSGFQVQLELRYDLVGTYGCSIPDYECREGEDLPALSEYVE